MDTPNDYLTQAQNLIEQNAASLSGLPNPLQQSAQNNMNVGEAQNFQNQMQQIDQSNIPQRSTTTVAPKKGNTFERLIPTLTGTGAGLLGAVLAPETGGLSLLIPAAAAAIGGGAGQAAENAATGQKVLQSNDITSGLEQGAGQLAGEGIAKGIGAAGNALKTSGEKAVAEATAAEAPTAEETAAQHGQLLDAMFPGNPRGDVGGVDAMLTRVGMPIDEMGAQEGAPTAKAVSDLMTPTYESALNDVLTKAGGTVDLTKTFDVAKQALAKNGLRLGAPKYQTAAKATDEEKMLQELFGGSSKPSNLGGEPLMNQAAQTLTRLAQNLELNGAIDEGGGLGALVRGEVNPADPLKTRQVLTQINDSIAAYRQAAALGQDAPSKQAADSMSKVLMAIRDHIQGQLYDRPEVESALGSYDPKNALATFEQSAKGSSLPQQVVGNLRDEVTNNLTNPQNVKDAILTPYSEAANADTVAKASLPNMAGGSNASSPAARRSLEFFAKQSRPAEAKAAPTATKAGKLLEGGGMLDLALRHDPMGMLLTGAGALTNPAVRTGVGGVLSKLGTKAGAAGTGILGSLVGATPGIAQGGTPQPNAELTAQITPTGITPMQQSPYAQDLNNLIATAMLPSGGAFTSAGSNAASVLGSLGPQLLTQIQNAAKAQTQEQLVQNLLNQAGGGQGAGMGLLSRLGQTFTGGPAGFLPSQNALGQAEGALQTDLGQRAAMPSVMQSAPTAQTALSGIQALIQSMYGNGSGVVPQSI